MKGEHALDAFFFFTLTHVICSHSVGGHLLYVCVSEKQASSLGLITLTHLVLFLSARLQSEKKLQATGFVFDPVTQTWYIRRR